MPAPSPDSAAATSTQTATKVTTFGETFLNLEDEEFYKYLEIAKKVMSGTIGNNILELEFPTAEEAPGGRQQFLMGSARERIKKR